MGFNLRNRNFLKLLDFTPREIRFLLDLSRDLKAAKYGGYEQQRLKGKNIALIFEKTSTRTRVAFEVAAYDQGAHVTYLGPERLADRPQGVDEGHRPGARPDLRRHRVPRLRAGDRRGAGRVRRRAGLERADRRVPPDPDPGRRPHDDRAQRQAAGARSPYCYLGDARNNMGDSLMVGGVQAGHGRPALRARSTSGRTRTWSPACRDDRRARPAPGSP